MKGDAPRGRNYPLSYRQTPAHYAYPPSGCARCAVPRAGELSASVQPRKKCLLRGWHTCQSGHGPLLGWRLRLLVLLPELAGIRVGLPDTDLLETRLYYGGS